jgi:predicted DNA-binding protein (MmcQ/YjbR family)
MKDKKRIVEYLLSKDGAWVDFPFGPEAEVYKIGEGKEAKMFAIIQANKEPVNLSLKCDPVLAEHLREKYETVMPGYHLNKTHWNTVICSGQLNDEELQDLIDLSYRLVKN